MKKLSGEIEEILRDNPRGMSISDISKKLDTNRNTIAKYLIGMLSLGQVEMRPIGSAKLYFQSTRVPLAKLMDASSDVMVILDEDLMVVQGNTKFCECIGVEKNSVIGLNFRDTPFCSFSTSDFKVQLKEVIDGKIMTTEIGFEGNIGFRYYSITLLPTVLGNGRPGVCIVADDITDLKMIKNALFVKEAQYQIIVSSIQDMVFLLDKDNNVLSIPSFNEELFGVTEEELVGKDFVDVLPRDITIDVLDTLKETRTTRKSMKLDFLLDVMGKQYWFMGIFSLHEDNKRIVVVLRDITERKKIEDSEKKMQRQNIFLNAIIDSLPHPLLVIDPKDYTIMMANSSGVQDAQIENPTCYALNHQADKPCDGLGYICPLSEVIRTKKSMVVEHIHYNEDGDTKYVEIHAHPILDADGNVTSMIEYIRDVTERKISELSLQQKEKHYQDLVNSAAVGIGITNLDETLLFINKTFANMLGYEREELESKSILIILPPDGVRKVLQETKKWKRGISSSYCIEMLHKNGKIKDIMISAIPEKNQEGIVTGAFLYLTDISEQNQTIRHLEYQLSICKLFGDVATHLFMTPNLEQAIFQSLASITNVLGSERTFLFISDPEGTNRQCYEWSSQDLQAGRKRVEDLFLNKSIWWRNLLKQKGVISIPDISKITKEGQSVKRRLVSIGIQSFIAYPLHIGAGRQGYFGAGKSEALAFSEDEYNILEVCANVISKALEYQRK